MKTTKENKYGLLDLKKIKPKKKDHLGRPGLGRRGPVPLFIGPNRTAKGAKETSPSRKAVGQ